MVSQMKLAEGLDQPGKWPGASSGVTLGFGFDCGYSTAQEIETAWKPHLAPDHLKAMKGYAGITGQAARRICRQIGDRIKVTKEEAGEVLERCQLDEHLKRTRKIYPELDTLTPTAQTALFLLVLNRGNSLTGARRAEMRAIQPLVRAKDYAGIAAQIRSMKRIWPGNSSPNPGIRNRREREAKLAEGKIPV